MTAALVVANAALRWNAITPACRFRSWTGTPCPLCGGTRSLKALSELDLVAAAQFNPLVFGTFLVLGVGLLIQLVDRMTGRRTIASVLSVLRRLPGTPIVIGIVLVNWIYLILRLP